MSPEPEEMPDPLYPVEPEEQQVRRAAGRRTRRSFLIAAAASLGGYELLRRVGHAPETGRQPDPLRAGFRWNADIWRGIFQEKNLAPTYPVARARELRLNGNYGLTQALKPESWRLQLVGVANPQSYPEYSPDVTRWQYAYVQPTAQEAYDAPHSLDGSSPGGEPNAKLPRRGSGEAGVSRSELKPGTPGLLLTMEHLHALPHTELVTQFKCIEGWSEIVQWGGVRLADLIERYPPAKIDGRLPRYVYIETPDGDYYCGFNMDACTHPQSLLVYEMGGKPISRWHGAPLRLHTPIKYGYKQIKRIGLIAYTNERPDDYWAKLGYDWYAGL